MKRFRIVPSMTDQRACWDVEKYILSNGYWQYVTSRSTKELCLDVLKHLKQDIIYVD